MSRVDQEKYKEVLEAYDKRHEETLARAKSGKERDAMIHFHGLCRPCCHNEDRNMNGWCKTCGDPCF